MKAIPASRLLCRGVSTISNLALFRAAASYAASLLARFLLSFEAASTMARLTIVSDRQLLLTIT